jgi:hypothetical protein
VGAVEDPDVAVAKGPVRSFREPHRAVYDGELRPLGRRALTQERIGVVRARADEQDVEADRRRGERHRHGCEYCEEQPRPDATQPVAHSIA